MVTPNKKILLTQEWLNELDNELLYLKETKRVEIAEKLKEAISYGDLSENAEYQEARDEQAQVELRISELEEILKPGNYEIIDEEKGRKKKNNVMIGSEVTIEYEDDGKKETETYMIVGSQEASILEGKISNESPIGKAVIGKSIGDNVKVKSPAGETTYTITQIK